MSINFNATLGTYVALDAYGQVLAIYSPSTHGTVEEFRNEMGRTE
ncbi:hypothetical protein ACDH70_06715 [Xanthomonas axonopodis pv. poinsettiicola]|nr:MULTISPECIES: hypothetical protein [Xanthomonas]